MTGISDMLIIAWVGGLVLSIIGWVFLYFFLSGVVRRGIDQSVIREQTDDIEDYHKAMLAIESQKLALLRMQTQMLQEQAARGQSGPAPDPATVTFAPNRSSVAARGGL